MSVAVVQPLPAGWGRFTLEAPGAVRSRGARARSYGPGGERLAWWPDDPARAGGAWACDVEACDREAPPELARLVPAGEDFWGFWVRAEVTAKLLGMPILEWVRGHRAGRAPVLPVGADLLVVAGWGGRWTLAFGRLAGGTSVERVSAWAGSRAGCGEGRIMTWATPAVALPAVEVA